MAATFPKGDFGPCCTRFHIHHLQEGSSSAHRDKKPKSERRGCVGWGWHAECVSPGVTLAQNQGFATSAKGLAAPGDDLETLS